MKVSLKEQCSTEELLTNKKRKGVQNRTNTNCILVFTSIKTILKIKRRFYQC